MARKKTLYKSILKIEILSDEPIPEETSLQKILHETDEGMWSGKREWNDRNVQVTGINAVKECDKHGTDTDFFYMDGKGDEMIDE